MHRKVVVQDAVHFEAVHDHEAPSRPQHAGILAKRVDLVLGMAGRFDAEHAVERAIGVRKLGEVRLLHGDETVHAFATIAATSGLDLATREGHRGELIATGVCERP